MNGFDEGYKLAQKQASLGRDVLVGGAGVLGGVGLKHLYDKYMASKQQENLVDPVQEYYQPVDTSLAFDPMSYGLYESDMDPGKGLGNYLTDYYLGGGNQGYYYV